jgi:hypothetical protein
MAVEENEAAVHRFYDELWNSWRLEVAQPRSRKWLPPMTESLLG